MAGAVRIDRVDESGRSGHPDSSPGHENRRTERVHQRTELRGGTRAWSTAAWRGRVSAPNASVRTSAILQTPRVSPRGSACRPAWATPSLRQARGAATMAPSPDRGQEGGANAEVARRRCRDAPTALTTARDRSLAMVRPRKHTSSPRGSIRKRQVTMSWICFG